MKSTLKYTSTLLLAVLIGGGSAFAQQSRDLQNFRAQDKTGLNVFETPKTTDVEYDGLKIRIGGANTLQFQGLTADNDGAAILDIGPNFNLPTSNFDIDAQLADGVRMHLRTYLSSRHHPEPYVKDGYMQIDKLDFIQEDFMADVMDKVTFKVGHMEINYGDNHFRRSDNGQAIYNPFVGNYIMDSFTTEVGGEVYFQNNGLLAMVGVTNGKLNQSVVEPASGAPQTKLSFVGKIGYDSQINEDLRVRLTGSVYTTSETASAYLYTGDRAGGRYYHVLSEDADDFRTGRFNPAFNNELTSIMINPFVKFQGLEFYGVIETSYGKAVAEPDKRTFNQYAAEVLYRFGATEDIYVGGRYNLVTGEFNDGNDVDITRINIGGGWFMTKNILAKLEYVKQTYDGFSAGSIYDGGEFSGIMLEAVISF
ncbi:MAG: hypothetical protein WD059_02620 [Balneolaceae bacterium]